MRRAAQKLAALSVMILAAVALAVPALANDDEVPEWPTPPAPTTTTLPPTTTTTQPTTTTTQPTPTTTSTTLPPPTTTSTTLPPPTPTTSTTIPPTTTTTLPPTTTTTTTQPNSSNTRTPTPTTTIPPTITTSTTVPTPLPEIVDVALVCEEGVVVLTGSNSGSAPVDFIVTFEEQTRTFTVEPGGTGSARVDLDPIHEDATVALSVVTSDGTIDEVREVEVDCVRNPYDVVRINTPVVFDTLNADSTCDCCDVAAEIAELKATIEALQNGEEISTANTASVFGDVAKVGALVLVAALLAIAAGRRRRRNGAHEAS